MKNDHGKFTRAPRRPTLCGFLLLAALLATAGCAPRVSSLPEEKVVRTVDIGQNGRVGAQGGAGEGSVITHGLEEDGAPDPWQLAREAESAPPGRREELLLQAVAGFIESGRHAAARTLLEQLYPAHLEPSLQRRRTLLEAALEQGLGRPAKALELLAPLLADADLPNSDRASALLLKAASTEALGRIPQAVQALMARDLLLQGDAQLENQHRLLALLGRLDSDQLRNLQAASADTYLTGWISLALILAQTPAAERGDQLSRWRELYPHHPASRRLLDQLESGGTGSQGQYGTIALLLPLTSPEGAVAQAFYDGFMAAQAASTAPRRPTIILQDVGADSSLAAFYYQAARNEKADFVVGPLGRKAVEQLLAQTTPDLPTLLLGPLPSGTSLPGVYSFSLSPEQDARMAAGYAYGRGLRKAAVIGTDSDWGRRVGEAFSAEWRTLGGSIVGSGYFPPGESDPSGTVKQVLAVRMEKTGQAGGKSKPRLGRDVDVLFLAVKPAQGRLLVPLLRFYGAFDLPLYATSYIFGGRVDPVADADLEGVIFGDMPWVVEGAAASPYRGSPLDRIYALGLESYALVPRLGSLQANPLQLHHGIAMTLSVTTDGTVVRHPAWYQFRDGRPVPLSP